MPFTGEKFERYRRQHLADATEEQLARCVLPRSWALRITIGFLALNLGLLAIQISGLSFADFSILHVGSILFAGLTVFWAVELFRLMSAETVLYNYLRCEELRLMLEKRRRRQTVGVTAVGLEPSGERAGPAFEPADKRAGRTESVLGQQTAGGDTADAVLADHGDRDTTVRNFIDTRGQALQRDQHRSGDVLSFELTLGANVKDGHRLAHRQLAIELVTGHRCESFFRGQYRDLCGRKTSGTIARLDESRRTVPKAPRNSRLRVNAVPGTDIRPRDRSARKRGCEPCTHVVRARSARAR